MTLSAGESVTAQLDASGNISTRLASTLDADTSPADAYWRVDVRVTGADALTYFAPIPSGGVTVDLSSLEPGATPFG